MPSLLTRRTFPASPACFLAAAAFAALGDAQDVSLSKPWAAKPEVIKEFSKRAGFNYDEEKVPQYKLPDPLSTVSGETIRTPEQWRAWRPELLDVFRDQVYGRRPDDRYSVSFETVQETKDAFDGAATGRQIIARIALQDRTFEFPFVLLVPNHASTAGTAKLAKTAPAVVHINNRKFVSLDEALTEDYPFWPAKLLIQRGYATASFHTSDVDPDERDGYELSEPLGNPTAEQLQSLGIRAFFANGAAPTDTAWRSLSAWGWAASRVLDHLETLPEIDPGRVAVSGHSRGGKTALWAACEDSRFAIAYSNNSGCGGAALSRRAYGETVERITSSFPHWFCRPFAAYGGKESKLPVDQHQVISLIAPRAVYVASADEDLWADPRGEYLSLIHAAPVYELLGREAIEAPLMPPLNQPRHRGATGYHIRTGGHGLGEQDWKWFLDFADLQWSAQSDG